jgi:hypothetical protein
MGASTGIVARETAEALGTAGVPPAMSAKHENHFNLDSRVSWAGGTLAVPVKNLRAAPQKMWGRTLIRSRHLPCERSFREDCW